MEVPLSKMPWRLCARRLLLSLRLDSLPVKNYFSFARRLLFCARGQGQWPGFDDAFHDEGGAEALNSGEGGDFFEGLHGVAIGVAHGEYPTTVNTCPPSAASSKSPVADARGGAPPSVLSAHALLLAVLLNSTPTTQVFTWLTRHIAGVNHAPAHAAVSPDPKAGPIWHHCVHDAAQRFRPHPQAEIVPGLEDVAIEA
jgi:hypothetical protein